MALYGFGPISHVHSYRIILNFPQAQVRSPGQAMWSIEKSSMAYNRRTLGFAVEQVDSLVQNVDLQLDAHLWPAVAVGDAR